MAGGVLKAESGIIDPKAFTSALAEDARDRGVEVRTQAPVEKLVAEDGTVVGVEADGELIEAETVVCAAGAQTDLLVEPFVNLPVRQFVYCNVRVEVDAPARSLRPTRRASRPDSGGRLPDQPPGLRDAGYA